MNKEYIKNIQEAVCEGSKKMHGSGLVAGTWGNIAVRVDDDYMVITPSGMSYDRLCADDMVLVNMHDLSFEGPLKPSIEAPMHAAILLDRPEINASLHNHSTFALAIATARRGIPPICDDQLQILGGDIRLAPYTLPGTIEMAKTAVEALKGRTGALIANHGAVTLGRTLDEALVAAIVLEKTAQIYINTQCIGGPVEISEGDAAFMRDFFLNKYGQK